ncbi:MAG: GHKL domain-containing protein [Bdellovibrionales bacterium]|nr:GHKL domain-containing protein [Bdellovibrionales bacterium]
MHKNKWLKPSKKIDPSKRTQVRLLLAMLLWRGLAMLILATALYIFPKDVDLLPLVFAFTLNITAYFIAKTRFYLIGLYLIISENLIIVPTIVLSHPNDTTLFGALIWLGFATAIGSLILSTKQTLFVIFATAIAAVVILLKIPQEYMSSVISILVFTLAVCVLAFLSAQLREKFQKDLETERSKVIHSAKMAAIGEMVANVAHEINSPLGAIALNAEMIQRKSNDSDSFIFKKSTEIASIVKNISDIIYGLKNFSRNLDSSELKTTTPSQIIKSTLVFCKERFDKNNIRLQWDESKFDTPLHTHQIQISQVLLNLLNNAFDAVINEDDKWVEIKGLQQGSMFYISVINSGEKIPKQMLKNIFQPFFTTKPVGKGTGLGLSISKEIIETFNGEFFYDETNPNTCFTIGLPILTNEKRDS